MQRRPHELADHEFDVLIIGAGAFGAAAARETALRGLRTALIDRADFGGGTSAECFKMVHGGIRYLQHADIRRVRASCHERSTLLRIAPHLVHPLPIAIPTYGRGRRGRTLLHAGARVYDLLTLDRNTHIKDPQRRIGRSRCVSREEFLQLYPYLRADTLDGALIFEDGQMHNPARLVLATVQSAAAAGATACNYIEALQFLWDGAAVRGARVRDRLSGIEFEIRSHLVLNAAGPWADYLQRDSRRFGKWCRPPFSRDACFVIARAPTCGTGIAVEGSSRDKDAVLGRARRHLFVVPWRDKTLVGVWHCLFPAEPDRAVVHAEEIEKWIAEINAVYPALELASSEVTFAQCGLVPFGQTASDTELSFGKHSLLIDHRLTHGITGLVTLVGIRYTTARGDAARAVQMLLRQSRRSWPGVDTSRLPLPGGDIEDFTRFQAQALRSGPPQVGGPTLQALLRNHGTGYTSITRRIVSGGDTGELVNGTTTLLAEIDHAVAEEMAVTLDDVVLRRTDLAAGSHPGRPALEAAARHMGRALRWTPQRITDEVAATERTLARHLARNLERHLDHQGAGGARHPPTRGAMLAHPPADPFATQFL